MLQVAAFGECRIDRPCAQGEKHNGYLGDLTPGNPNAGGEAARSG